MRAATLRLAGLLLLLGAARGQHLRGDVVLNVEPPSSLTQELEVNDSLDERRHSLAAHARARNLTATTGLQELAGAKTGGRGSSGVMFTLHAPSRDVILRSLDFYTGKRSRNQRVQVRERDARGNAGRREGRREVAEAEAPGAVDRPSRLGSDGAVRPRVCGEGFDASPTACRRDLDATS